MNPIYIRCLTIGHDPEIDIFELHVTDLSQTLASRLGSHARPFLPKSFGSRLVLHKVHIEPRDFSHITDFLPGTVLRSNVLLSEYWKPSDLDMYNIHLVISDRGDTIPPPPIQDATPEDQLREIVKDLERFQLAATEKLKGVSSSEWATPNAFNSAQNGDVGRILNGRPFDNTGPPIGLHHPVFDAFLERLSPSATPLVPGNFVDLAMQLLPLSQKIYTAEKNRDDAFNNAIASLFGQHVAVEQAPKVKADGVITGPGGTYCLVLELKNEIGGAKSDPSVQGACSYSKYWLQPRLANTRRHSCCPTFILAIAGPWMCVLGAILLDTPVVQPLTDFLWLGFNPQQPSQKDHLVLVLHSLNLGIQELRDYYQMLDLSTENLGWFLPYATSYVNDSSHALIKFFYTQRLGPAHSLKTVFRAQVKDTNPPQQIVVKFSETYNSAAHKLLANQGLAPKLLYDGSKPGEKRYSGRSMIVMDFVHGVDLHTAIIDVKTTFPDVEKARADIEKAIQLLHAHNFVFGDLRRPNVMLVQDGSGKVTGGMLVDFDWCNEHGKGVYPSGMNRNLDWPEGTGTGETMLKGHDLEMMNKLWP